MVKVFLLVAAILVCWAALIYGDSDVDHAWKEYQAHFPSDAKSADDNAKRKENFAKVHAVITKHNAGKHSYKMGHNKFSAMSIDEKKSYIASSSFYFTDKASAARYVTDADFAADRAAKSTDYRTHRCMQPVKDQAACGSCWAFAATAVTEFGHCIKTGKKVALSEQQLVDCTTVKGNGGCNGGYYEVSWQYLSEAGGQATAASYPYTAVDGTCKYPGGTIKTGAKVSKTTPVIWITGGNTTAMISLLSRKIVMSAAIAVVESFFNYASGVYAEPTCGENILGYHAIAMVGHGTLDGMDYWVIRNSWSSGWGAAGYMLFQRGVNLCGIENHAASTNIVR